MRKVMSLFAALVLTASVGLAVPQSVSAANPYGPCLDQTTQIIRTGENFYETGVYGVEATIDPGWMALCYPVEASVTDSNASVLQVHLVPDNANNHGFLTLGIVMCDDWPTSDYCKGYPGQKRFFAEYLNFTGNPLFGFAKNDLGPADNGPHTYRIAWDGDSFKYSIDGVLKKDLTCCVTASDGWIAGVQAEIHDRGDGIATSSTHSIIKNVSTKLSTNGAYTLRSFGYLCSFTSPEISGICNNYVGEFWTHP